MKSIPRSSINVSGILVVSLGILTGCGMLPSLQRTASDADSGIKQFRPAEGMAQVVFFHGPVRTCKSSDCIDQKLGFPFSIYIDGIKLGTVTSRSNYLRADISAGKHVIQWTDIKDKPEVEQGDMEINMSSGQAYFIRVSKGTFSDFKPSAIGTATAVPTGLLENVGAAGQAEVLDRTLIVADRDAIQRLSGGAITRDPRREADASVPALPATVRDKMTELKVLYERGLITKDEYDGKRKQFLDAWK